MFVVVLTLLHHLPAIVHHLDGIHGTLIPFVAQDAAGTVLRLLQVVARQQAVDDRNVTRYIQFGQSLCGALANIVEVGSIPPDDTSDGDDGIHLAAFGHLCGPENKFEAFS